MEPAELLEFCLDTSEHEVQVSKRFIGQTPENHAQLIMDDYDIRFRGVELRDVALSEPGAGSPRPGKAKGIVLLLGRGDPFIMAFRFHTVVPNSTIGSATKLSHYVLANGYHRAYALWQAGYRKIPCVFADISMQEVTAFVPDPHHVIAVAASFSRPPLFKDFFDPRATMQFQLPKRRRLFNLTWKAEFLNFPEDENASS
jgi:hypothetical protein